MNFLFSILLPAYLLTLSVCCYASEDATQTSENTIQTPRKRNLALTEVSQSTEPTLKKARTGLLKTPEENASRKDNENLFFFPLDSNQNFQQEQNVDIIRIAEFVQSENMNERNAAAGAIYSGMQDNLAWVQNMLAELAKSENLNERKTAAGSICSGMQDNAVWAQKMLAELVKSENLNERKTVGRAIYIGMQYKASWVQNRLTELANSENVNEQNTAEQIQLLIQSTLIDLTRNANDRLISPINNSSSLITLSTEELNNHIQFEVQKVIESREQYWAHQFSEIFMQVEQLHEENKGMARRLTALERAAGDN